MELEVILDWGVGLVSLDILFLGVVVWFDITRLPGLSRFWILGKMQKGWIILHNFPGANAEVT